MIQGGKAARLQGVGKAAGQQRGEPTNLFSFFVFVVVFVLFLWPTYFIVFLYVDIWQVWILAGQ